MPSAKDIKSSMRAVRDTMKITKAMYMISTIKMRKAKHQLEATEPYFYGLQTAMTSILHHFPDMRSKFFGEKETEDDEFISNKEEKKKRVAYIVLSSDRGLAGAYNHHLFTEVEKAIEGKTFEEYQLYVLGGLGVSTLTKRGYNVVKDFHYSVTNPTINRARLIAGNLIEKFAKGEFDEVQVIYTRMITSMESRVEMQQLLPLKRTDFIQMNFDKVPKNAKVEPIGNMSDNKYSVFPNERVVLEEIVKNYVTGYLYGTLVEATACEENARMSAMKSATDNAKSMLKVLTLQYNRVRQAAITQQITEICSGARALKRNKSDD